MPHHQVKNLEKRTRAILDCTIAVMNEFGEWVGMMADLRSHGAELPFWLDYYL